MGPLPSRRAPRDPPPAGSGFRVRGRGRSWPLRAQAARRWAVLLLRCRRARWMPGPRDCQAKTAESLSSALETGLALDDSRSPQQL